MYLLQIAQIKNKNNGYALPPSDNTSYCRLPNTETIHHATHNDKAEQLVAAAAISCGWLGWRTGRGAYDPRKV